MNKGLNREKEEVFHILFFFCNVSQVQHMGTRGTHSGSAFSASLRREVRFHSTCNTCKMESPEGLMHLGAGMCRLKQFADILLIMKEIMNQQTQDPDTRPLLLLVWKDVVKLKGFDMEDMLRHKTCVTRYVCAYKHSVNTCLLTVCLAFLESRETEHWDTGGKDPNPKDSYYR